MANAYIEIAVGLPRVLCPSSAQSLTQRWQTQINSGLLLTEKLLWEAQRPNRVTWRGK